MKGRLVLKDGTSYKLTRVASTGKVKDPVVADIEITTPHGVRVTVSLTRDEARLWESIMESLGN